MANAPVRLLVCRTLGLCFGACCVGGCMNMSGVSVPQYILVLIFWVAAVVTITAAWESFDEYTWPAEDIHA